MLNRSTQLAAALIVGMSLSLLACAGMEIEDEPVLAPLSSRAQALSLIPDESNVVILWENPLDLMASFTHASGLEYSQGMAESSWISMKGFIGLPPGVDDTGVFGFSYIENNETCSGQRIFTFPVTDWQAVYDHHGVTSLDAPLAIVANGWEAARLLKVGETGIILYGDPMCPVPEFNGTWVDTVPELGRTMVQDSDIFAMFNLDQMEDEMLQKIDWIAADINDELLRDVDAAFSPAASALTMALTDGLTRLVMDTDFAVFGASTEGGSFIFDGAVEFTPGSPTAALLTTDTASHTVFNDLPARAFMAAGWLDLQRLDATALVEAANLYLDEDDAILNFVKQALNSMTDVTASASAYYVDDSDQGFIELGIYDTPDGEAMLQHFDNTLSGVDGFLQTISLDTDLELTGPVVTATPDEVFGRQSLRYSLSLDGFMPNWTDEDGLLGTMMPPENGIAVADEGRAIFLQAADESFLGEVLDRSLPLLAELPELTQARQHRLDAPLAGEYFIDLVEVVGLFDLNPWEPSPFGASELEIPEQRLLSFFLHNTDNEGSGRIVVPADLMTYIIQRLH